LRAIGPLVTPAAVKLVDEHVKEAVSKVLRPPVDRGHLNF
jgi:hypothetical protein